ncbi:SH3 domain-containing protein [Persicobacter psychrovividus]|uniref:SH3b domain-containing protein n=1 Tax=Persicobacter psychrovividus TaxID=387638 RepID=A0ABM7VD19_9BACT|nr:hypothetical protein PEPS_11140 [Persicobacter psychrovividus]
MIIEKVKYWTMLLILIVIYPKVSYADIGKIIDKDGFVNVRSAPTGSASILTKIKSNEIVSYFPTENEKWWLVLTLKNEMGFVHHSRIEYLREGVRFGEQDLSYEYHYKKFKFGEDQNMCLNLLSLNLEFVDGEIPITIINSTTTDFIVDKICLVSKLDTVEAKVVIVEPKLFKLWFEDYFVWMNSGGKFISDKLFHRRDWSQFDTNGYVYFKHSDYVKIIYNGIYYEFELPDNLLKVHGLMAFVRKVFKKDGKYYLVCSSIDSGPLIEDYLTFIYEVNFQKNELVKAGFDSYEFERND